MKLTDEKRTLIESLKARYGSVVTRKQLVEYTRERGADFTGSRIPKGVEFPFWIVNTRKVRVGRGAYNLDLFFKTSTETVTENATVETSPSPVRV